MTNLISEPILEFYVIALLPSWATGGGVTLT